VNGCREQKADFVQTVESHSSFADSSEPACSRFAAEKDAWDQLSEPERYLISGKLKLDHGQATRGAFNVLVTVRNNDGGLDQDATADRIETVRNFLTATGACEDGKIWNRIRTIEAVGRSELAVTVYSRPDFLSALQEEGYAVNRLKGPHKEDSARALTPSASDPQLHFVNDNPTVPLTYFVHWDSKSVWFRRAKIPFITVWVERLWSAMTHREHASPGQVREYLRMRR
jgi:hypothetical protein